MNEECELIDINKNGTGIIVNRETLSHIPADKYHLSVEVWTKRLDGKILLTQRHPDKRYGLLWKCNGGAVLAGEESKHAALRELIEEVGLVPEEDELIYLGDIFYSDHVMDSYLYNSSTNELTLNLQKEEVVDSKWVTLQELEENKKEIVDIVYDRYLTYKDKLINK